MLGRRMALRLVEGADASMTGAANVPRAGGALMVGNHAVLGLDAFFLTPLLLLEAGRVPRFLAERTLFRLPGARSLLAAIGAIPGEPASARRLLESGELVCVYPGGVDDSFKTARDAYRLQWKERAGFARVAMAAKVPIVPVAATGVDEIWDIAGREHVVGRRLFGSPRYDLPFVKNPLPRKVPLRFHVLPPIDTGGDPEDAADVERVRRATWEALEGVLAPYREQLGR
jgi:1-acyl-sn-glycerol-3-phosphate acyltransferase